VPALAALWIGWIDAVRRQQAVVALQHAEYGHGSFRQP
jgi:hypothetical protein